jgi:hypothetical protein
MFGLLDLNMPSQQAAKHVELGRVHVVIQNKVLIAHIAKVGLHATRWQIHALIVQL